MEYNKSQAAKICKKTFKRHGLRFNINLIKNSTRSKELMFKRRIVANALRAEGFLLIQIGDFINRDYSTVIRLLKNDGYIKNLSANKDLLKKIHLYENKISRIKSLLK